MATLAAKEIFTSYRLVPQPFRSMLLKKDKRHQLLIEGVRKCRLDASAGEGLRLSLAPGTPVLAPADLWLTEAGNPWYGSWAVFTGRHYVFSFYHLDFHSGMSTRPIRAGSVIGAVEALRPELAPPLLLHLMVTKKRFFGGGMGEAVDAMDLIERGVIRPPFMPGRLD
ncbi:MAG: hypothetical protein PHV13_02420 [Candidatus ainarchaeum sp.]|nr:hypothetical protein [Candidatus ainarchaeum sp.]